MGFVGELIDKNKAIELVKKYSLTSPWPGRNENIANNMIAWAYDEDNNATCLSVRSHQGLFLNGHKVTDVIPRVNVLIWRDQKIRIDLYEDLRGDYDKNILNEIILVAERILAPIELQDERVEIKQLAKEGSIARQKATLMSNEKGVKISFKTTEVQFLEEDEIWKR